MLLYSRLDRKTALIRAGHTMQSVADACGVTVSMVSHVMAGRKATYPAAVKIMTHVAGIIGAPVSVVFPGVEEKRAGGTGRRVGDRAAEAA